MQKLTEEQKNKIKLGLELLCNSTTSLDHIQKIAQLVKGLNPKIDSKLDSITEIADKIQKVQEGDVISLSAEKLPEQTDKQKNTKKLVLLLLAQWKDLHAEVTRIRDLQAAASTTGVLSKTTATKAGKIGLTMKGPLGVVTIMAAGIVAVGSFVNSRAVTIAIKNEGCKPLGPFSTTAINIPGLMVPSDAIIKGESANIKIPGLAIKVDATNKGEVSLSALNYSKTIHIPYEIQDLVFDGESISGKTTMIDLSNSKTHDLFVKCK